MDDDVQKLMKIARQKTDKPIKTNKNLTDAHSFAIARNIKVGKDRIPTSVIYDDYVEWKKGKPQERSVFFRDFAKLFKPKLSGIRYYLLDGEVFDLSERRFWKAQKRVENERNKHRREKEETKEETKEENKKEGNQKK